MKNKDTVLSVVQELRDLFKEILKHLSVGVALVKPFENQRLVRNSDGNLADKKFPIVWAKEDLPSKMNTEEAAEACKKLGDGWRPASIAELDSIIDRSRCNPAIIPEAEVLGLKTDDWYLSNTPVAGFPSNVWCVGFHYGFVNFCSKGSKYYVRPVRSSQ
ncbi:MAG: Lcl C-terminal domain-containing protein [Candidatus Omnitrophota bacterium]